jgi:hypothetical protein
MTKEALFLEECFNYMYAFGLGDLERVMLIPVPIRKWLIRRWNEQKEKERKSLKNPDTNSSEPLTPTEKSRILNRQGTPSSPHGSRRNT